MRHSRTLLSPVLAGALLLFAGALLLNGCGGTSDGAGNAQSLCRPGDTRMCVGPGACEGAQECVADGSGYATCTCGSIGTGGTSGGTKRPGGEATTGGSSSGAQGGQSGAASGAQGGEGGDDGAAGAAGESGGSGDSDVCDAATQEGCDPGKNCVDEHIAQCVDQGPVAMFQPCLEHAECSEGLNCIAGNCRPPCDVTDQCDGGYECAFAGEGVIENVPGDWVGGCATTCDSLSQNCGVGEGCYFDFCSTLRWGDKVQDEVCDTDPDCFPGYGCLLGDPADRHCGQYCDPAAPNCPEGYQCYALDGYAYAPPGLGVCAQ